MASCVSKIVTNPEKKNGVNSWLVAFLKVEDHCNFLIAPTYTCVSVLVPTQSFSVAIKGGDRLSG